MKICVGKRFNIGDLVFASCQKGIVMLKKDDRYFVHYIYVSGHRWMDIDCLTKIIYE